jgi:putative spermidine/putrescine transport system permease protein
MFAWAGIGFLVIPLLAILPLSFSSGDLLALPVPGWSTRWYRAFLTESRWVEATRNSLLVGAATALVATPLGTLAAIGLRRLPVAARRAAVALILTPLIVPVVILALAVYFAFTRVGLAGSFAGLVLAHVILALPFVVLTVLARLEGLDPLLLRASLSLGARPITAWRRVLLPSLAPSVVAAALLAFATSFDELVLALFIAGPAQLTLPRQMYGGLREFVSPTICAAAVMSTLLSVGLLGCAALLKRGRG